VNDSYISYSIMLFVAQPSQLRSGTKILDLGAKLQKVKFWKGKNLILIELQGYFQKYIYIYLRKTLWHGGFGHPHFGHLGMVRRSGLGCPATSIGKNGVGMSQNLAHRGGSSHPFIFFYYFFNF
jgi:hypothetical protein